MTEYHQPNHNVIKLPSNASQSSTKTSTANNSICTTNNTSMKYINCSSSSSNLKENDEDCGTTNITNFTSNKISRRYSITTNEDFNINITINTDDSSSFSNSSTQRSISTSCLSKSSCYISTTDPNTCDLEMDKTFGGSLGSFCPPEGRRFVRTRVSIPPSARNRDRSARPESFRISSDMATHTRVLLKARSFAGASLRESPTHKKNGRRNFARTSLREDQLTYHRDKGYNQQNAMSKMEFLRARFASTSGTASDSNSYEASSDDCVVINSRPYFGAYVKPDDEYYGPEPADNEAKIVNVRTEELQTSLKTTNIVTVSTTTPEEYIECTKDSWNHGNLDSLRQGGATIGNTFYVPSSDHYGDNIITTIKENTFSSSEPHPSPHTRTCNKESCTTNQLTRKISLAVPDSYLCEDSQESLKSQKLRTRSFTGMVTPRETITENIPLPREVLNDHKTAKKGNLSLRVTQNTESERIFRVATMTRRARVTRDGYAFRFSSDLGLGTSSRVTPRSKREVFV
ncbi:hypothetical protein Hamer_G012648 [Homarus americanus]|uniref:Uncharacterized protein n=1 Tax=Homarus americanus TaxID=6706 RepID=A0A8J5JSC3_HOMAM|nr:hypothetical protein Hamer_G012648 [Homarus americanus]